MEKVMIKEQEHSFTIFFIFLIFCWILVGCEQKCQVQPDREEISIGRITDNSNVFFSFYLVNHGKKTVKVDAITTSVSNVAIQQQVDTLRAGDSTEVKMVVVGNGMEGEFRVKVNCNLPGKCQPHPLYVSGYVEKTLPSVTARCTVPFGGLLIEKREVKFGKVKTGKVYKDTLLLYNPTAEVQTVRAISRGGYVSARLTDPEIRPHKAAYMELELKVDDLKQLGKLYENVIFAVGRDWKNTGLLTAEADVTENFDTLSESGRKEAPCIEVEQPEFNFGRIQAGTRVKHAFVLKNTGHRDLIIRKIQPSCGCTAAVPAQRVIAPGNSTSLDVEFRSAGRQGTQQKSVLLFTNDPVHSEVKVWISGEVL